MNHRLPIRNIEESTGVHSHISGFTKMLNIAARLEPDSQC